MAEYVTDWQEHYRLKRKRITRCRDCVNSFPYLGNLCCGIFSVPEDGYYVVISPDDFCSKGEPREVD